MNGIIHTVSAINRLIALMHSCFRDPRVIRAFGDSSNPAIRYAISSPMLSSLHYDDQAMLFAERHTAK